jgi:hypothetical protein
MQAQAASSMRLRVTLRGALVHIQNTCASIIAHSDRGSESQLPPIAAGVRCDERRVFGLTSADCMPPPNRIQRM